MIRIMALMIVMVLISICGTITQSSAEENSNIIGFGENQQLKILIVADTQDTENPQEAMLTLLNTSLDTAKPDLVVLLGDMIHGPSVHGIDNVKKAIDAIVTPIVERKIPFALVFGNHDEECGISNEEQLKIYQSYPGCLATEGKELPGCGNYYFVVENPIYPENPVLLWFFDSGNRAEPGRGKYGYVKEEQNAWMEEEFLNLKEQYGAPISYVFQHIPVPQVYNMIKTVPFGTKGSVSSFNSMMSKWYILDDEYIWAGSMGEGPGASEYDSGEFDTWKKTNVKAAFFGHDHVNDYCGTYDGIDLIATSGVGFFLYGKGDEHGTRIVTINADAPAEYETQMLYYKDIVKESLPGFFAATLGVLVRGYVLVGVGILSITLILVLTLRKSKKSKAKRNDASQ